MDKVVGILGGGQLGRMLTEAANRLNIKVITLDGPSAPAKRLAAHGDHVDGSFKDAKSIRELAGRCDVLTIEIEHVDVNVLRELQEDLDMAENVSIEPSWKTIETIQDKYRQKLHLGNHGVKTADSFRLDERNPELGQVAELFGYPFMLKARRDAYDGRGNFKVDSEKDFKAALDFLGDRSLYAEKFAPFKMELAVIVVRTSKGAAPFPVVETVHERSICKLVYAPPRGTTAAVCQKAQDLAVQAVKTFQGRGVYAVEMFLLPDDSLLVNEIAPRVHNSGHLTIEACPMSQFEAHLHAILDLPIPERRLRLREPAIMLNILGGNGPRDHHRLAQLALNVDGTVHLYGKGQGTLGRKMGHITLTAPTMREAESMMAPLIKEFDAIVGSKQVAISKELAPLAPVVAVVMGSDTDLATMAPGISILEKFGIPHMVRITSAHRTPDYMAEFAARAAGEGLKVIIAAAGGAAHLPGMAAAHTSLPVIGVPVKATHLDGVDSMHSIVQMPRGVPVATVGISNSTNAALLAARILGVDDLAIRKKVEEYAEAALKENMGKDAKLHALGWKKYMEQMPAKK